MQDIEFLISRYLDNELNEVEQRELFAALSADPSSRELFKQYLDREKELFSYISEETEAEFSNSHKQDTPVINIVLDEKAENKAKNKNFYYKAGFYISAAAAVIFMFFAINRKTEVMYNTKEVVRIDTVIVKKEKPIIKYKMVLSPPQLDNKSYLKIIETIPITEMITKNQN